MNDTRTTDHAPTPTPVSAPKADAIRFEDDPYAMAYQRGISQRTWRKIRCGVRANQRLR